MRRKAEDWTALGWTLAFLMCLGAPAQAQDTGRIWGRIHTTGGAVHTGFIRWDRTEASWGDILDAAKELPEENYFTWLRANDRERATRTLELRGYRISWNEIDPDFPMEVLSGVRFGHLDSLVVLSADRAELTLRSGRRFELEARGSNLGASLREVVVDVPGEAEVELEWDELERVVFSAPEPGAVPAARRLYGTVEDRSGNRFTGSLAWDRDEVLESDLLNGEEMRRRNDHEIPFHRIRSLTRIPGGTRVEYVGGGTLDLRGSNDVDRGNRGVQIADPGLGVVVVPWEQLQAVRFHEAGVTAVDDARLDGGRLLAGTVVTRQGEEIEGELRWDADEAGSWEILNGEAQDIDYHIEFGFIRRIVPGEEDGATVTLADGRTLELEGSRDVSPDNRGLMVASDGQGSGSGDDPGWRLIQWEDIREVRFHPGRRTPSRQGERR